MNELRWLAAPTLALALLIGGCGEKKDEAPQPTGGQAPAPMSERSPAEEPKVSQGTDTGTPGTAQGQKPEEKTEASQKG